MLWGNLYAGLGFISHLLNILPAVLSNLAVSLMHVRLSTSVLPQMPPLPSVKSDVFSQTACRCYPTFPKAKRVAPDMSASFSQLSSPLCTLFFFFTPSSQISPPLLPVRQISSLFIVSRPVSTPLLSLGLSSRLISYWAPWLGITRFHSPSFPSSSFFYLCIRRLGLLLDANPYTLPSVSTPLCASSPPRLLAGKNRRSNTSWIPHRKCVLLDFSECCWRCVLWWWLKDYTGDFWVHFEVVLP